MLFALQAKFLLRLYVSLEGGLGILMGIMADIKTLVPPPESYSLTPSRDWGFRDGLEPVTGGH